jgi:hypothetical protein
MNTPLLIAALLTFVIGAIHSWLGERRLLCPLLAPDQRQGLLAKAFVRRVIRFAWHLTSIAWWGMGATVAALAMNPPLERQGRLALWAIAATFLVTGALILITSRGRHLAWPVFLAIVALIVTTLL